MVALLLLALGAASRAEAAETATRPEQYLPDDTVSILNVDVETLFDSPLGKKYALRFIASLIDPREMEKDDVQGKKIANVFRSLGFNPFSETTRITVAGTRGKNAYIVWHAPFDPVKFHATFDNLVKDRAQFMKIHPVGDRKIYEWQWTGMGPWTWHGALADKSTWVLGWSKENVLEVVDKVDGRKKSLMRREMREALQKVPKGRCLSIVATHDGLSHVPTVLQQLEFPDLDKWKPYVEKLRMVDIGVTPTDELQFEATLSCDDEAAAQALEKAGTQGLKALKALVKQPAAQTTPGLPLGEKLLAEVVITRKERTVLVKARLTKPVLEEGVKQLMKRTPGK